jgi:hypothetical protein
MIWITATLRGETTTRAFSKDKDAQAYLEELKESHLSHDWNWRSKEIAQAKAKVREWHWAGSSRHQNDMWRKWKKRLEALEEERADFQRIMGLQEPGPLTVKIEHK